MGHDPAPLTDLVAALDAAGWSDAFARFAPGWAAMAADLAAIPTACLEPATVTRAATRIGLARTQVTDLLAGLSLFHDRPLLVPLAHHAAWLLRHAGDQLGPGRWPQIERAIHPAGPLFWAYAILAGVDGLHADHAQRGIDAAITTATLRDLGRWLDDHRRRHGHAGFAEPAWMHLHMAGRLLEIGRLQFAPKKWQAPVRLLRHLRDHHPVLVMEGGLRMRADGRFQMAGGSAEDPAGFTTAFLVDHDAWHGHAVDARGRAGALPTRFSRSDWDSVLERHDPVWECHIPAGSPLTASACRDSFTRAATLLPRCFPGHGATAFASVSWLFDAQLADHLREDANLVRFQRTFHLYPVDDRDGSQIRDRVLGPGSDGAPPTALQRAVRTHLDQGGIWCESGAVLPVDEAAERLSRVIGDAVQPP